jgi:hypothetical protein
MPKNGTRAASTSRSSSTSCSALAGSPGPFEKKTPSGPESPTSWTWAKVAVEGRTCTSIPCCAIRAGVMALIPRSTAATVKRRSPTAGTT